MNETFFRRRPVLCAMLFAIVALVPFFATRDFAPLTELRNVSMAREALSSGHIFAFTNHGAPAPEVMPLHMWLLMLLTSILGGNVMLADAMLSLIPACVVIAVIDKWLVSSLKDSATAGLRAAAALVAVTSASFLFMAGNVGPGMLTTMWMVLALWEFYKMENGDDGLCKWLLPLWLFLGMFSGGIYALVVPVLAMVIGAIGGGHAKVLVKAFGVRTWVMVIALTALWFAAAWMEGGPLPDIFDLAFEDPIWQPAISIWGALAPWCLLAVPAVFVTLFSKEDNLPSIAFIVGFVALSCLGKGSLPCMLPLIPMAVAAAFIMLARRGAGAWSRFALVLPAMAFVLAGVLLAAVALVWRLIPSLQEYLPFPFLASPLMIIIGAVLAASGFAALVGVKKSWSRSAIMLSSGILASCLAISPLMGKVNDFVGYANVCSIIPQDAEVYALHLEGAADMDAILGREVHDLGDDSKSFIASAPSSCALVVGRAKAALDRPLTDILAGQSLTNVGPCSVYEFKRKAPVRQAAAQSARDGRKAARKEAQAERQQKRAEKREARRNKQLSTGEQ